MALVEKWTQVAANIRKLNAAVKSSDPRLRQEYHSLIKRGTCFVVYGTKTGLAFAPSKFIGYADNDLLLHTSARRKRDGRKTNKALEQILGAPSCPRQSG